MLLLSVMSLTTQLLLLIFALIPGTTDAQEDIRLPPSIYDFPENKLYSPGLTFTLPCAAVGSPAPVYQWLFNNLALTANLTEGSYVINSASMDNNGYYQCIASNGHGRTTSGIIWVQLATIGRLDPNAGIRSYTVQQNAALVLVCNFSASFPAATISWLYNTTTTNNNPVTTSREIQLNPNGNLHFASVISSYAIGRTYFCSATNEVLATTLYGGYSRITVSGSVSSVAPSVSFSSPAQVVALESQQTALHCFFLGSPVPTYQWTFNGGTTFPPDWIIGNTSVTSPATGTDPSAAGEYICTGTNAVSTTSVTIQLTVEAIPVFNVPEDQPQNMNYTDGDTATITCRPHAKPAAQIQWYKNTVPFNRFSLPPKFLLNEDSTTLTISGLCKDCDDGTSDLMSIQCNASNAHGFTFAQAYLNVLLSTTITSTGKSEDWAPNKEYVFECAATCDHSTPCHRANWTFEGLPIDFDNDSAISVDSSGTLRIITANDEDGGESRIGEYVATVTNGVSESQITYSIVGPPNLDTASVNLWWVGLLIALLVLLLLLLLLLYFCCCFLRDGKSYPVDENEKKNGNDPVKELRDTGFQHYVQTASDPVHIYTNPVVYGVAGGGGVGRDYSTLSAKPSGSTNGNVVGNASFDGYAASESGRYNLTGGGINGQTTMASNSYGYSGVAPRYASEV